MTWLDEAAALGVLTPYQQQVQERLDMAEVPEHLPAARRLLDDEDQAVAVVCHCGMARYFATWDLAVAVAKHHARTGEEL